ncbi:hypothetical protein [uncultured Pseudokineococcus sp.]|uniref:hypothetical protein n=1 Tax=uncultured Pseudokineococcus sp. TaxID=1642928 RepID=UPI002639A63B|nr:hypothetical protein [uncultured Pseudokineococcus sp.]
MSPAPRRLATAATATATAVCLALTAAPAAHAAEVEPPVNERHASSGQSVSMDWMEVGRLPGGVLGNYHQGWLTVETPADGSGTYVYGYVTDYECPPGVTPDDGHGWHGEEGEEEPEGPFCEDVAYRSIDDGDLTVVADKRHRNARITGTLAVTDHGTPLGNPVVDIRVKGGRDTFLERSTSRYRQDGVTYTSSYSTTGRTGTVTGRIGQMVFDDAEGEYSSARLSSWTEVSRVRVR